MEKKFYSNLKINYTEIMISGEGSEKVDWVRPVAENVPVKKLDAQKLAKAHMEHGVEIEINTDNSTANIIQNVVEGMLAPKTPSKK